MAVELHTHRSRVVVHADLSHCSEAEFLTRFDAAATLIRRRYQPYCILWDITGSTVTRRITEVSKSLALFTQTQRLSTGSATVGVTGIKRLIARAIKPDMYWADDVSDARRWLTSPQRWRSGLESLGGFR